jgi:hypothetical protein
VAGAIMIITGTETVTAIMIGMTVINSFEVFASVRRRP